MKQMRCDPVNRGAGLSTGTCTSVITFSRDKKRLIRARTVCTPRGTCPAPSDPPFTVVPMPAIADTPDST